MGLKKKDLERMFQQALAAYQQPNKYEQQYDAQLAKMDDIINRKDFSNLPTEYAPDFHDVAVEQDKREKLANLHQTGIGAWQNNSSSLEPIKQFNASLYAKDIRQGNDLAVKDFVANRDQLRSGLLGNAMQRNKGSLDVISSLYQQKMNQPSMWGQILGSGIGAAGSIITKLV